MKKQTISFSEGHHYGAPLEACLTLTPDHELVKPMDGSRGPFIIEAESQDRKVHIKLYGPEFKGKCVQTKMYCVGLMIATV